MSYSLSPLMQLPLPAIGPGGEAGPAWATDLNNALGYIDSHNHDQTVGPAGHAGAALNQNAFAFTGNLDFGGYGPKNVGTVKFTPQGAPLASSFTQTLYTSGSDLYFNDGSGNAVQITASGAVNTGASGTIGGMDGNSSVTYATATKVYTFLQSSTFPSKLATGDILLYEAAAGVTNAVTVKSPASLGAAYTLTMPAALPGANALMQVASTGVLSCITQLPGGLKLPSGIAFTDTPGNFLLGAARVDATATGTVGFGPIGSNVQVFTAPPPTLVCGAGTVTNGGPGGAIRLIFAAAHGMREGEAVQVSASVTLPGNIVAATTYIVTLDASAPTTRINLYPVPAGWLYTVPLITAASPAGLTFGALLAYSSTGSGTLTVTPGWVAPPGVTRSRGKGCGAGAGGQFGISGVSSGSGGGAGAFSDAWFSCVAGTFYPMVVGPGGTAGLTAGFVAPTAGGVTTFFGITVNGGAIPTGSGLTGGLGGAKGSGATVDIAGGDGGSAAGNLTIAGANGGASRYGGGGACTWGGAGLAGLPPGSGGGGGANGSTNGGPGANGIIEIEW